jgi:iron(III) transport system permease protein
MLASILVVLCLVLLAADLSLRGRGRYARLGSGVRRPVRLVRLGAWRPLAVLGLTAWLLVALGVPLVSLARWLIEGTSTAFPVGDLVQATGGSLQLGVLGAALTVMMALPIAWLSVRASGPISSLFERSTYIGHALPGIVVALALVTVAIDVARPVYQTLPLLLIAYAILFMPLAVVSIRAALLQAPPALEDAARSLGVRHAVAFVRVTLRLILSGVGAGAAMVFLAIVTELTATLLLAPIGTRTLTTRFWAYADEIAYGAAAPYALLLILLSLPATFLLTRNPAPDGPA